MLHTLPLLRTALLTAALCAAGAAVAPRAEAQAALRPASASIALIATVQPSMRIVATEVVRVDSTAAATIITERVHVRTNVAHRLVARAAARPDAELRRPRGVWMPMSQAMPVVIGETETLGETTYLVQCRTTGGDTAARSCGFSFELESANASLPATSARSWSAAG